MRLNIYNTIMLVLCVYQANGQCINPDPASMDRLDVVQDFVRTRLDKYRITYNPVSVPYSTEPQKIISQAAYLKIRHIDPAVSYGCGEEWTNKYLWGTVPGLSNCCGRHNCVEKYINYTFADAGFPLPTDLTDYKFVVSDYVYYHYIDQYLIENRVDNLVQQKEAVEIIFGQPFNRNWGSAVGQPKIYRTRYLKYLAFASAAYSGNESEPSAKCLPFEGDPLPSKKPIIMNIPLTTTTTIAPVIITGYQCMNPNPDSDDRLDIFQDFVRTRLDAYRKMYTGISVPYSLNPEKIISQAIFQKIMNIPSYEKYKDCGVPREYLWKNLNGGCCGDSCVEKFLSHTFADVSFNMPTDITDYKFVVIRGFSNNTITLNNIEEYVDKIVKEEKSMEVIFHPIFNSKWGSVFVYGTYFGFASASDSDNITYPSAKCLPYEGNPHPSIAPVLPIFSTKTTAKGFLKQSSDAPMNPILPTKTTTKGFLQQSVVHPDFPF